MKTKSVKIESTKEGLTYFYIYEVNAAKHDGEVVVYERFLNEEDAEKTRANVKEVMREMYRSVWVSRQIVWC